MLMDKHHPARTRSRLSVRLSFLAAILCSFLPIRALPAIGLSDAEALRIGKKIWQNECNGTVDDLHVRGLRKNDTAIWRTRTAWGRREIPPTLRLRVRRRAHRTTRDHRSIHR